MKAVLFVTFWLALLIGTAALDVAALRTLWRVYQFYHRYPVVALSVDLGLIGIVVFVTAERISALRRRSYGD